MAKFSKKLMGKEVGSGELYATPHTMKGSVIDERDAMRSVSRPPDPNTLAARDFGPSTPAGRVSFGDPGREFVKKDGIKIRGTGAATKGVMARGPMG